MLVTRALTDPQDEKKNRKPVEISDRDRDKDKRKKKRKKKDQKDQNFLPLLDLDLDPGSDKPFKAASTLPLNLALCFQPFLC